MPLARDIASLWHSRGFRRLMCQRVVSQGGDGMFQVGIAAQVFFDPTTATSPGAIAAGFAVLLLPFTVVGPFVGPLIDRWQRQRILLVGNMVRAGLVAGIVAVVLAAGPTWLLYLLALVTLSVNRFLLASMTAGLPRVVPAEELLTANAVLPTLGTISAAAGGAIGAVVTFVAPRASDASLAAASLSCAAAAFLLAAAVATSIGHRELGPARPIARGEVGERLRALGTDLVDGARYLYRRVTPFHALAVMAAQRLLYGLMFVASILISRHVLGDPDHPEQAIAAFGVVVGFAAVGFGLAAVLTPLVGDRVARHRWILMCLGIGACGQALLAFSIAPWALLSAAVIVSFAVQGAKIAVDTIVQRDTDDRFRGRAFTLYDMAYNVAFVSAAVIGGLVLPDDGYSAVLMGCVAVAYVVVAAVFARAPRHPVEAL